MQKTEQLTGWFPHIQGWPWGDSSQGSSSGDQPGAAVHAERSGEAIPVSSDGPHPYPG